MAYNPVTLCTRIDRRARPLMTEGHSMSKAVIAASRFGFGARPGELVLIEKNPEAWLLNQLQGQSRLHEDIRSLPSSASVLVAV